VTQLHFIIVEDIETDRSKLAEMIKEDFRLHGQHVDLSFYESGEAFLEHYRTGACDALFLDIMMGGISGVETARRVRKAEPRLPIIFTTTEPDFALEGFSVHVMDYLVKPLEAARISWCLQELREYLAEPAFLTLSRIDGRGHSTLEQVVFDDILYGLYQSHRVNVRVVSGMIAARLSFRDFVGLLPHNGRFCVCSRGLVVNFSYVARVEDGTLFLKNGEKLLFSKKDQEKIRKAFCDWNFFRSRKGGWG